jgi:hypothetical protein
MLAGALKIMHVPQSPLGLLKKLHPEQRWAGFGLDSV